MILFFRTKIDSLSAEEFPLRELAMIFLRYYFFLSRYFETVRHLKAVQIFYRFFNRFWRVRLLLTIERSYSVNYISGKHLLGIPKNGLFREPDLFNFLNKERSFSKIGWCGEGLPRLWLYNLHYFDYLCGSPLNSVDGISWIRSWVASNPLKRNLVCTDAWDPYPTSLRSVNWIKWHLNLVANRSSGLSAPELDVLFLHGKVLSCRLEYHLLGNHLWANCKALIFLGVFFQGTLPSRWRELGFRLLEQEIREQINLDGGHFELSPMYHLIVTEDVLDLICLAKQFPQSFPSGILDRLIQLIPGLFDFAAGVTHPDGFLSHFNDSSIQGVVRLDELLEYSRRLGVDIDLSHCVAERIGGRHWRSSGYARLDSGIDDGAVIIADVGRAGADYIPGHAHADALSFEMSILGRRLFVNGGTSTYELCLERLRQRGTRAHNTVCVDGIDSSAVWHNFRLGQRITDVQSSLACGDQFVTLTGSFLGFHSSKGSIIHKRIWHLKSGELTIEDFLEGAFTSGEARLHIAPGWTVQRIASAIQLKNGQIIAEVSSDATICLERSTWGRSFGDDVPVDVISIRFSGNCCRTFIRWIKNP